MRNISETASPFPTALERSVFALSGIVRSPVAYSPSATSTAYVASTFPFQFPFALPERADRWLST